MRSCKIRLEQIADPNNLREAFLRAARGKTDRFAVVQFRDRLQEELESLRRSILSGNLRCSSFSSFVIHEPKQRRIHAPSFADRVLHHALFNLCEPDFERWQVDDSFACRRSKGREAALRRSEYFAAHHPWFLKLDIAKYFDSIPHDLLLNELRRRFRDHRMLRIWESIVKGYASAEGRGLPIGALSSQHLATGYARARVSRLPYFSQRQSPCTCFQTAFSTQICKDPGGHGNGSVNTFTGPTQFAGALCIYSSCQARAYLKTAFWKESLWDVGHRARTGSTAAAPGTTPRRTVGLPTATGTRRTTATTTWASA